MSAPPGRPESDGGFLSRWSQRKAQVRQGVAPVEPATAGSTKEIAPEPQPVAAHMPPQQPLPDVAPPGPALEALPMPTLDDVAALGLDANYTRFMASGVDEAVKRAALKKLFAEPQFNVMDGLDIYIDDYGVPDPLPPGMLRQMNQAWSLGLFGDAGRQPSVQGADAAARVVADAVAPQSEPSHPNSELIPTGIAPHSLKPLAPPDEDPDLQLQPNYAAGGRDAEAGTEREPGRLDGGT